MTTNPETYLLILSKNTIMQVRLGIVALWSILVSLPAAAQVIDSSQVSKWADIPVVEWQDFYSYPGRFRVRAPGTMEERVDTVQTAVGPIAYHTFTYVSPRREQYAENVFYMVSYCDYPPGTLHEDSTQLIRAFLDATVDEAVTAVRGELIYDNPIDYFDYPGRFWRIHYRGGDAVIKTKALLVGRRYYSIQTAMKREMALNRASDTFIDSFRLIGE